ncbi:hypothetical protein POM88_000356 [Heracleum sosnowskyi]|uniref:Uncharacterized protein n=1 Tax=Heracleum sosnowskyi TaxID=360622 RepID=A0AAD8JDS5_9APIA|nr:hypothetical protein POM88_000356 [Heracleum sosnowskyi]
MQDIGQQDGDCRYRIFVRKRNYNVTLIASPLSFLLIQASPSQCCSSGSNWTGTTTSGSSGSVQMKACYITGSSGYLEEMVSEKRRELIEAVSEVDNKLAEAFLSDKPISPTELEPHPSKLGRTLATSQTRPGVCLFTTWLGILREDTD